MADQRIPSEAEGQAFVAKLNKFRARLNATEKEMLDALVAAAHQGHEQGDVEVFWFVAAGGSGLGAGQYGAYGAYSGSATYSGMRSTY